VAFPAAIKSLRVIFPSEREEEKKKKETFLNFSSKNMNFQWGISFQKDEKMKTAETPVALFGETIKTILVALVGARSAMSL